eukprot:276534-Rhodomonas_salina.1
MYANGTVCMNLVSGEEGEETWTITGTDSGGTDNSGEDSFQCQLTLLRVELPPWFDSNIDPFEGPAFELNKTLVEVCEDTGMRQVDGMVLNISAAPSRLDDYWLGVQVPAAGARLFTKMPMLALNGTMTFELAPNQCGEVQLLVWLVPTSVTNLVPPQITLRVDCVNDAP